MNSDTIPTGSVGDRIKAAREHLRLTQDTLGTMIGQGQSTIGQWERDRNPPPTHMADKLAAIFDCDPEWILFGRGRAPSPLSSGQYAALPRVIPFDNSRFEWRKPSSTRESDKAEEATALPVFGSLNDTWGRVPVNYDVPVEWIPRPPELVGIPTSYAVYVLNNDMGPRYRHGEICLIHPGRPVKPDDFVLVRKKDGMSLIRQLVAIDEKGIELIRYPGHRLPKTFIPSSDIASVHKIIGTRTI